MDREARVPACELGSLKRNILEDICEAIQTEKNIRTNFGVRSGLCKLDWRSTDLLAL